MMKFKTMPGSKYEWNETKLHCGGEPIGTLLSEVQSGIQCLDEIKEIESGVFEWTRCITIPKGEPVRIEQLMMGFQTAYPTTYGMIPAVTYNGNEWGKGLEPKGFEKEGKAWVFAYHRTPIAGATYSEGTKWTVAFFGKQNEIGFSCSLLPEKASTAHHLIWPLQETPISYVGRDRYGDGYREQWIAEPELEYRLTAYLVIEPFTKSKAAWSKMLDTAWSLNFREQKAWHSPDKIWELGVQYVKDSLWAEDGLFRGFSIGLKWNGEMWAQRKTSRYKIGWTGQNISLANSLLYDYLINNDSSSLDKGIAALDTWAQYARLDNGLIRCHFDYLLSCAPDAREIQDACHLGAAAMNFFEAFELAERCGRAKPEYKEIAVGICDFAISCQSPEGKIGKAWSNRGISVDSEGTIGSSLIPPLIKAYKMTQENKYLEAAENGYTFYIQDLLKDGFTTAGALDTYCIDKESAIPLLKAGLALYEATNNAQYLQWAEHASWYLATWQWHQTVRYPEGSALHALAYDTFGGTSVSTQHHHIDPYALDYVLDWFKLGEITGDQTWIQRAKAAWVNGTIGVSDGTLEVSGKPRPAGSQDEGFFHTRWGMPFDVSEWLVAWPTAFRLETLRHTKDWSLWK
ncbi:hypothetical protein [Paenibacillus sp. UNC451MF]|uniref:hypothetical protein n=1 Tax=Paenibacillus sp. UNC451MF TaxID=1449063 RepID=UPI00068E279F|nr:hypothetical protein [Paenibacillus sp. UNC451MF]